jgi:hypothetical protein
MPTYQTLNEIQSELKRSIIEAIDNKIADICIKVVQKYLQERVYDAYTPQGDFAYDRTMELFNSVTVGNLQVGVKYIKFEIYMDTEKIKPYVYDDNSWNAHASVDPYDTSENIPLWVEEGTSGSLWDREGAHYMEQSYFELDDSMVRDLADRLRLEGWKVISVT